MFVVRVVRVVAFVGVAVPVVPVHLHAAGAKA
jgi:hypothetical protein